MSKYRITSILILLAILAVGYFVYATEVDDTKGRFDFRLGLDLAGGTQLTYEADLRDIPPNEADDAMSALRAVIERRVDVFGVAEPLIQIERGGIFGEGQDSQRLIVELPGVTNTEEAKAEIGRTPLLEFKLINQEALVNSFEIETESGEIISDEGESDTVVSVDDMFLETSLTGRFLKSAQLQFDQFSGEPIVMIEFDREGALLFAQITSENVGEVLAIFLDGEVLSTPVIREVISGGVATISGGFNPQEARELTRNLNLGALPVPISLIEEQTIGPSLGRAAVESGLTAAIVGVILVALFLIFWYRLPGLLAVLSLASYIVIMLALFKLIPVTLTSAGIAGFILSMGMAVDANILIFERFKEERKTGKPLREAASEGFSRAWLSIRDSNLSTIITAIILFYATTSLVKGFALVLGIGVLVSMLSAITITRTFLVAVMPKDGNRNHFLFGSGVGYKKSPDPETSI